MSAWSASCAAAPPVCGCDGLPDPIVVGGSLTHATFDVDLAALVGPDQLEVAHFVLVTADTGDLAGHTFLVIDANGEAGYQAGEDYVIELSAAKGGLSTWNFIPG